MGWPSNSACRRPTGKAYPVFFCRECGQEHLSVAITYDDGERRVIARPVDEPVRDEAEADGTEMPGSATRGALPSIMSSAAGPTSRIPGTRSGLSLATKPKSLRSP
jgi:hypothetical protein